LRFESVVLTGEFWAGLIVKIDLDERSQGWRG